MKTVHFFPNSRGCWCLNLLFVSIIQEFFHGQKPFAISHNPFEFLPVPHNMSLVVQKRLVADPSLIIMDIQKVILSHFNVCKDFDLFSVLDCLGHQKWNWKTAPNVAWMSKTAEFVCSVLKNSTK